MRWFSSGCWPNKHPILHIPHGSQIFKFAASKMDTAKPVFSNFEWTIKQGESWAIVSNSTEGKVVLVETLKSQTRIQPFPPRGLWPFLTATDLNVDAAKHVRVVSFAHRPQIGSGQFYDYSARYGAVREQDRFTLRQYLLNACDGSSDQETRILRLAEAVELSNFLSLPLIALSNGQTRRARIVKALLHRPKVLVLDEPLTGLDISHRPRLLSLLKSFHQNSQPHIIMALRAQDPIPDWITHLLFIQSQNRIISGAKQHVFPELVSMTTNLNQKSMPTSPTLPKQAPGNILVDLQNVNVKYHDRHVLKNITWTIRQGEKWFLTGPNGSGKTTLLSLITGDVCVFAKTGIAVQLIFSQKHPQSYTQGFSSSMSLFSKPRRQLATPVLARLIGISSPEIYNAFPRKMGSSGLTVFEAIGTGFEGVFTFRRLTDEQERRVQDLLNELGPGPDKWLSNNATTPFASRPFAALTPGEQSFVLLLRALVNTPPLLILDEALSGMDDAMSRTVSQYLRERISSNQAVIWVSHWENENPWYGMDVIKRFRLGEGIL